VLFIQAPQAEKIALVVYSRRSYRGMKIWREFWAKSPD
jgi:hypothetical protein